MLQVTANDASGDGGGGFQCCWTTAHVTVSVRWPQAAFSAGWPAQLSRTWRHWR